MKQRILSLLAMLLALCLLCGCSNLTGETITEFITGEKPTTEEVPRPFCRM